MVHQGACRSVFEGRKLTDLRQAVISSRPHRDEQQVIITPAESDTCPAAGAPRWEMRLDPC